MPLGANAAEKRQHIIETAYRLFKRDGFHATGMDKIIAEAAVAKMTMYRHFPSKDGLIVEVLDWRAQRFKLQLDRLSETTTTPHEKIATIFDWHERWFDSADFHGCLFQHALAEFGKPAHAVFESVVRQKGDLQERIRDILAQSLPYDRAEHVATTLFMLIEAATVLAHMGQGKALSPAPEGRRPMFWHRPDCLYERDCHQPRTIRHGTASTTSEASTPGFLPVDFASRIMSLHWKSPNSGRVERTTEERL